MTLIAVMAFVTMSHKLFWGMSWPIAIGVTICIAAASWLVVYPALGTLIERGGIVGAVSSIFGG
jgi:hypothetical protein